MLGFNEEKCSELKVHSNPYHCVFFSSKPKLCILADSDEESSSAGSSDEEEIPPFDPQSSLGDKNTSAAADG